MVERVVSHAAATDGGTTSGLRQDDLLGAYRTMLLTRAFENRVTALNRQGKVPIVASCRGHEAAQIGSTLAMDRSRDLFFPYYRDIALAFTLGYSAQELMLAFMARAQGPFSGGRQILLLGADPRRRFFHTSNVVAAQVPHGVGAALGIKLRKESAVVITHFGDGATSQGEWHEALNFAGIHKLPIIFFCENNGYAISVPLRKQMAIERVSERAAGYGMPGVTVDGTELAEVFRATCEAAERARTGGGPTLVEAHVVRLTPHTTDDDERRYRSPQELEAVKLRDPLPKVQRELRRSGLLTDILDRELAQQAAAEVDAATQSAEAAPYPHESTLAQHVYDDG